MDVSAFPPGFDLNDPKVRASFDRDHALSDEALTKLVARVRAAEPGTDRGQVWVATANELARGAADLTLRQGAGVAVAALIGIATSSVTRLIVEEGCA